jgi:hypothetical protein
VFRVCILFAGKVIQISSTSFSAKIWLINSIWVLIKATLCKPVSTAVLAPRQKRAPLISIPTKFYWYLCNQLNIPHNPAQHTNCCHFWRICIPLAFKGNKSPTTLSLVENINKCLVSLNLFNLFCFPLFLNISAKLRKYIDRMSK